MVENIVKTLEEHSLLQRTYIWFMSDNGYHIGQFGQPYDKRQPYNTDIRVPMFLRGPHLMSGQEIDPPVSGIDVAPTILALAGVDISTEVDGRSLIPELFGNTLANIVSASHVFVEYHGEGNRNSVAMDCPWLNDDNLAQCSVENWCKCQDSRNNTYTCVITVGYSVELKYCKFDDDDNFVEAYNVMTDPYELHNIFTSLNRTIIENQERLLVEFKSCKAQNCRDLIKSCANAKIY